MNGLPHGYTIEAKTELNWLYGADFVRSHDDDNGIWVETDDRRCVLAYRPYEVTDEEIVELATQDARSRGYSRNPGTRKTALRKFANLMRDLGAYDRVDQRRKAA